jgi:hypothetical protein
VLYQSHSLSEQSELLKLFNLMCINAVRVIPFQINTTKKWNA